MKFKIEINCDNAAFGESHDDLCQELHRIIARLHPIADSVFLDCRETVLRDSNGNRVGFAKFTKGGEA